MTALIIVGQHSRGVVHLACDAAVYDRSGTVAEFAIKTFTLPHWPAAIANNGNAAATILIGSELSSRFLSFDEFVERADAELPGIVAACTAPPRYMTGAELIVVGISATRGAEAYSFRTDDSLPKGTSAEEAASAETWGDSPCKLVKLPDVTMTPVPNDMVTAANFEGVPVDADPEQVIWSMRKIVEMQRHCEAARQFGAIGGFATVTSVSADGIQQRMLARWPEDRVGVPLRPAPIDWREWHAANPRPGAARASKLALVR